MSDKWFIEQVFSLGRKVREEAIAGDKLTGGALAGVAAGTFAAGLVLGGAFWIPAAIASGTFCYKLAGAVIQYRHFRENDKLRRAQEVREELERIAQAQLPDHVKQRLTENLLPPNPRLQLKPPPPPEPP